MTERLDNVSARIDGVRQLGSVVNAMKGIAAARASNAREEIKSVDSYVATIAAAISDVLDPTSPSSTRISGGQADGISGLLIFCAEQGFAGPFSERILNSIQDDLSATSLFLVGSRGRSIAAERGLDPVWSAPMSSHTLSIPKLASQITMAIDQALSKGLFERMEMVHAGWASGRPQVIRQVLFPIDLSALSLPRTTSPMTQIPTDTLLKSLSGDYVHALVCKGALHAFAAENEARIEAMSASSTQITRELSDLEATLRQVRQEAITAEIIELGTGAASSRNVR